MIKVSLFSGESATGPTAVPLFTKADHAFEKTGSATLLPEVVRYIDALRPAPDTQYVLLNAMGAGEYFGSNINGDYFTEASLIHRPDKWTGNPLVDKIRAKDWAYGFPTFYYAHPYAHHRNKDSTRAFGEVELACWNDKMKRVELVTRVDKSKCHEFGGIPVWDKLNAGMYPDVSMGCAPAGTRITLANGQQSPIENVREGDLVLSHTGSSRRVERTMRRRYTGTLYNFKVYGFRRELPLTDEHPLWLVRAEQLSCSPSSSSVNKGRKQRHCTPLVKGASKGCEGCGTVPRYDFSWVRADEAEVGDYLAFPVPREIDDTVQSIAEARLLGYYLAEGFVWNYNDRPLEQITFCLSLLEKEIAEDIENLARSLGANVVWHDEKPEKGGRYVHVVSKELAHRCLTLCGSGAKTKVVAREILYMRQDLQLAFLGAYLDGDGGTYKGAAYFSTASEQLAGQLFVMLARCGVISSVNEIDHRPSEKSVVKKDTVEYQIWVGTDFSPILGPYTRKPVRPSLKIRGQRFFYEYEGTTYLMSPILEIEESHYDDDVFNFSVEEDDSYVAEGLATHNCKVPFDTCSICLDWDKYRKAQSTFDPKKHRSPGEAILEVHRSLQKKDADGKWVGQGIRGVSVTRADYCVHAKTQMNKILPDGRKVYVMNDYPKFFDISFVFIGADKTAKTMMKIGSAAGFWDIASSAEVAEKLGYSDGEKTASDTVHRSTEFQGVPIHVDREQFKAQLGIGREKQAVSDEARRTVYETLKRHPEIIQEKSKVSPLPYVARAVGAGAILYGAHKAHKHLKNKEASADDVLKLAFLGKLAKNKSGEIVKDVVPSQFAGKAVPALTSSEEDLPDSAIEALAKAPLESALSTSGGLGIVLRPHEFQRIVMINIGRRDIADDLDDHGLIFPEGSERAPLSLGPERFMSSLARLLLPLLPHRSALAPSIERRVVMVTGSTPKKEKRASSSHYANLLRKIAAAYNSYREQLMDLASHSQNLIGGAAYPGQSELHKLSAAAPEEVFSPLSVAYIQSAFLDEVGSRHDGGKYNLAKFACVERGYPSSTTVTHPAR